MPGSVPYFSQWESPTEAAALLDGRQSLAGITHWAASGARTQAEFIEWANHLCGMCCLKMALAASGYPPPPLLHLARASLPYGTYVREGNSLRGLIYAPFVAYVKEAWAMDAAVTTGITAGEIAPLLTRYSWFIASVHPSIRQPACCPPHTGGHLVLVSAADDRHITFHNPSGDRPETQSYVTLPLATFARFFAGRGIALSAPESDK
ncbi:MULTISPECIES: hypothetical protein [Yersiniaceae]|uniref:Peptidase C39-like domain-containing protein n=1 Tax=Nissabacter archeti TaxID=1917880 RepID=A0ABS5JJ41_9GAMM|nr:MULTISPECIES: hypothetical protein [Yersiniaceae]MBS0969995.1 hypothetical protein [Nissabacter archeti]PLR51371.1 hypothetical protein CYR52_09820 [Chimaeribacter arupi]